MDDLIMPARLLRYKDVLRKKQNWPHKTHPRVSLWSTILILNLQTPMTFHWFGEIAFLIWPLSEKGNAGEV